MTMRSISSWLPLTLIAVILTIIGLWTLLAHFSQGNGLYNAKKAWPSSAGRRAPGLAGNCSAVFEQGSAWVRWRNGAANIEPGWPVCVIQRFDRQLTEQCMQRRLRARGRPFQAVLMGDSRVRELFSYAAPRLGAVHEVVRGADNCWQRLNRTYAAGERRHGRDHWCSFARRGRLANVTYLVRHHLDQHYLESVQTLVSQCRRGLCPDLVLLNGGLHEMWRHYGRQWAVGVRALAEQAARLAPLLSWLARRGVTVLWPLIDPPMEDAGGGLVRMTPELGWLMNAALVAELGRLPGLRLWSSHIGVALWYHNLCRALQFPAAAGFRCADPLHPGNAAIENYLDILMNYVCDSYVSMPESQCCGIRPGQAAH